MRLARETCPHFKTVLGRGENRGKGKSKGEDQSVEEKDE